LLLKSRVIQYLAKKPGTIFVKIVLKLNLSVKCLAQQTKKVMLKGFLSIGLFFKVWSYLRTHKVLGFESFRAAFFWPTHFGPFLGKLEVYVPLHALGLVVMLSGS
jgi:hypothetical protein